MDLNQLIHLINRILCYMPLNNPMRGELQEMLHNMKTQRSAQQ